MRPQKRSVLFTLHKNRSFHSYLFVGGKTLQICDFAPNSHNKKQHSLLLIIHKNNYTIGIVLTKIVIWYILKSEGKRLTFLLE